MEIVKAELLQLTTRSQRVMEFVRNTNKSGKQQLESAIYLKARLALLEKYWAALDEQFAAVQVAVSVNNIEPSQVPFFNQDRYAEAEAAYLDAQTWLAGLLEQITGAEAREHRQAAEVVAQHVPAPAIRMRPIDPPKFTGDVTQWGGFRDLFRAVVTENVELSNAQRLQYLLTSCQGEAGELIRDIGITDANFAVAWAVLAKRYDNPRVVVVKLVERLLGLAAMSSNSAEELKQLLDGTNCAVRSLHALARPTDTWDDLLVGLTVSKLDPVTRYEWEKKTAATVILPTFEELEEFMATQLRTLEALPTSMFVAHEPRSVRVHVAESSVSGCPFCHESHALYSCKRFGAISVADRKEFVAKARLCFNCICSTRHSYRHCPSAYACKHCGGRHHSLLHSEEAAGPSTSGHVASNVVAAIATAQVFLGTARVTLHGNGRCMNVRALIDSGSQASFVSEAVVRKMGLQRAAADVSIHGIGSTTGCSSHQVELEVASTAGDSRIHARPLVLKRVTGNLPTLNARSVPLPLLDGLQLADAGDADSTTVDLLLGADVYAQIMCDESRRTAGGEMMAQRTVFGWILIGRVEPLTTIAQVSVHHVLLEDQLQRFWEQEEPQEGRSSTNEENACEQNLYETIHREADGRFTVHLPFRVTAAKLGESRCNAAKRLVQMERRLARSPDLRKQYNAFMDAYRMLGHMSLVAADDVATDSYFLPHHAVLKPSSTSTKLRVVFDASMPTSSGRSLNDMLMVGPRLQDELVHILLRWRTFRVAITADVEKMFRQVWVAPEHRRFQRILWRDSEKEEIREYNLNTITYGTACAPYLAVKAMQHLAEEERESYPWAAEIVQRDFYMDDCLTGADDAEQAIQLKDELLALMAAGGMKLLKWASNSMAFVEDLPLNQRELGAERSIDVDDNIKTLGVRWFPASDEFRFAVKLSDNCTTSKRAMLSEIARLFDPLSLLAPVVVYAKVLMQMLWTHGTDWDEPLPDEIAEKWHRFRNDMKMLCDIRVPRWLGMVSSDQWSLHAFCDASKTAYAACVYTRVITSNGDVHVQLLAAKTRVAPVKQQTIPRLELNGALLLVRLLHTIRKAMGGENTQMTAWTDSTVVLAWLQGQANRWPTYVANRVTEIQKSTCISHWRHVPGVDNPADVASRGIMPSELNTHELWWSGPSWLLEEEQKWPQNVSHPVEAELLEEKKKVFVNIATKFEMWDVIELYPSLTQLTRVTAYCRRAFAKNRRTGALRAEEIRWATLFWVGQSQKVAFAEELAHLSSTTSIPHTSKLRPLNPFIDEEGLLRVGGRLDQAALPYDERHPLILPHTGTLVQLLIDDAHTRAFHAGPKTTIALIQQRFWVLGVRSAVKVFLHRCVVCCRARPTREHQLMGDLPAARVTQQRAFLHTAVDYAGPVMTRTTKGRGHHANKSWIAVFVCLSSKATHLELVSDMTTQGFLAAFKRFTARRGHCSDVYADNGTNFVGADSELRRQVQLCTKDEAWCALLAKVGTRFHFAPPGSPHFNGLAEAAVKIAKSAMRRAIGEHTLTFEEMTTLLAQIEAVMNSRPLGPLTRDKDDPTALTPGHLLIGQPLVAMAEPNVLKINDGRLSRWQLVTKMMQHFWDRWHREYLHHLQQRGKWQDVRRQVKIGDIVLIRDENSPPTKWPLGRILDTHPGADGIVRVVTIKTANTELKRAITKICVLPVE